MVAFTPFSTRHAAVIDETVLRILGQEAWPMPRTEADYDVNTDVDPGVYIYGESHTNGPVGSGIFMQKIAMFEGTTFEAGGETSHRMAWAVTEDQRRFYRFTTNGSWAGKPWIAEHPIIKDETKTYIAAELPGLHDKELIVAGDEHSTITLPVPSPIDTEFRLRIINAKTTNQDVQIIGKRHGNSTTDGLTLHASGDGAIVVWDGLRYQVHELAASGGGLLPQASTTFLSLTDTFGSFEGRAGQFLRVAADQNTVTGVDAIPVSALPNDIPASKIAGTLGKDNVLVLGRDDFDLHTYQRSPDADEQRSYNGKYLWFAGDNNSRLNLTTTGMNADDEVEFIAFNLAISSIVVFSISDGVSSYEITDRSTVWAVSWNRSAWVFNRIASPHTHYFWQLYDTPGDIRHNQMLIGTDYQTLENQEPGTMADLVKGDPEALPRHYQPKVINDYVHAIVKGDYVERVSNPRGLLVATQDNLAGVTSSTVTYSLGDDPRIQKHYSIQDGRTIKIGRGRRAKEVLGFWIVARVNGVIFDEGGVLFGPQDSFHDVSVYFTDTADYRVTLRYSWEDYLGLSETTIDAVPDGADWKLEVYEMIAPAAGAGFEPIFCRYKSPTLPEEFYPHKNWGHRDEDAFKQQIYQKFVFTGPKTDFKASTTADLIIAPQGRDRPALDPAFGTGLFFWELVIHDSGANRSIATLYFSSAQGTADLSMGAGIEHARFAEAGIVRVTWQGRVLTIPLHGDNQFPYTASPQTTEQRDAIFAFLDAIDANEDTIDQTFEVELILDFADDFQWFINTPNGTREAPNIFMASRATDGSPSVGDPVAAPWGEPARIGSDSFTEEKLYGRYRGPKLPAQYRPFEGIKYLRNEDLGIQYRDNSVTFAAEFVTKAGEELVAAIATTGLRRRLNLRSPISDGLWIPLVSVSVAGGVRRLRIEAGPEARDFPHDPDDARFTPAFEQRGQVILKNNGNTLKVEMNGANVEPYVIDVDNPLELLNFYNASDPEKDLELEFRLPYDDGFTWDRSQPTLTKERPFSVEVMRTHLFGIAPGDDVEGNWGQVAVTGSLGVAEAYVDPIDDYEVELGVDDYLNPIHDADGDGIKYPATVDAIKVTLSNADYETEGRATRWQYLDSSNIWRDLTQSGRDLKIVILEGREYSYLFQKSVFADHNDKLRIRLISTDTEGTQISAHSVGTIDMYVEYEQEDTSVVLRDAPLISAPHTVARASPDLLGAGGTYLNSEDIPWTTIAIDPIEMDKLVQINMQIVGATSSFESNPFILPCSYIGNIVDANPPDRIYQNDDFEVKYPLIWDFATNGVKHTYSWKKSFLRSLWNSTTLNPIMMCAPLTDGVYLTGFKAVAWGQDQKIDLISGYKYGN